jgi:hypothetical protein
MADRPAWLGVTNHHISASPATAAIRPALLSSSRPPKLAGKFNFTGIVVKMVSKTSDIAGPQAKPLIHFRPQSIARRSESSSHAAIKRAPFV